ncbi:hypothetical protein [Flavihumibacter petaseus]|uniref:Right handed beta helix domain-containing protein n=1 Tax=Flavihumibacter petaseus NBRC 106054 TaxID=1220578 RepID=A0A0E9N668_9BACT|nr:hypothetical protein [Flavihumibacter petaseus]GAO45201.1 hypothetical protein FPE01S_04_04450 [Flavihumibacter petaseus NBRC 106054]
MKIRYVVALLLLASCSKEVENNELLPVITEPTVTQPIPQLNYYVSQSGSILNSGKSADQPWSLDKANEFTFSPGDTINLVGTLYGSLMLTESGTEDSVITITGGKINSGNKSGITLYNNSNITIRNVELQGSGEMSINLENSGIRLWSDDGNRHANFIFEKIIAKGYSRSGIESGLAMSPTVLWESEEASMSYAGGFDHVLVNQCQTDSNGYAGINMAGSWPGRQNKDIIIRNSVAFSNRGIKGYDPHSGHGIFLTNVVGGKIDSCEAAYNGWENGSGNIGIWTASAVDVTIQNSKSYRNISITNGDGGGFDIDGGSWNCTMQYNYSYENDGAGYLIYEYGNPNGMKDHIVRYNISHNDGRKGTHYGGITVGGDAPITNLRIYNNTVMMDRGSAIRFVGGQLLGVYDVKNNVLIGTQSSYLGKTPANNVLKDPNLNLQYIPLQNSPVIDLATEISGLLPALDFYGKPIVGKRDIGAVEY